VAITNLVNWLGGGTRGRELDETRRAWVDAQRAIATSPLAGKSPDDLAYDLIRENLVRSERCPDVPILAALHATAEEVFEDEDIGPFEPRWRAIEGDATLAVEFRKVIAKRRRFATDFKHIHGLITEPLLTVVHLLVDQLPESCFWRYRDEDSDDRPTSFEVPLIELLEDPSEFIERLILAPYTNDTLRLDLFAGLRSTFSRNIVAASGFAPTFNPVGNEHRLVVPSGQKNKSPEELADMYLAGTPFRRLLELPVPFHIPEEARFEHCHIIGGTGHGKTQLMQRMIYGDLEAARAGKRSVVVIDSQGDMINRLTRLALFSPDAEGSLADRLIVVDPTDVEFPAALNLFDIKLDRLEDYRPADRERVLNGVVELYETFFGALLGAELTQKQGVIFMYLARLMLTIPGATIHTLMELMEDGKPFKPYMAKLEGSAGYFFDTEFFHPSFAATKKQILRRLWGVLSTPAFERMFAQTANKLDLFQAMQDGKIILINTAKDLLKREGSQLFGQFFIAMLAQAALERSTVDPEDRTPTMVYVDEAQEYFGDDVETILNQARKYRVGLTLAHQTLDQLSPRLRAVLHANTTTKCVGGVSSRDARAMGDELRTTSDFIESMKRKDGTTQFAVWIKHETPHAIRLTVPLGFLERQPILLEEEYQALVDRNRAAYCCPLAEVPQMRRAKPEEPLEVPRERTRRHKAEQTHRPVPEPPEADPSPLSREELEDVLVPPSHAAKPPPRPEPRETGKGGPQHRYVQHLIKTLAEEHGFRAVIEEAVPGGSVDVGLRRGDFSIACEVSITSSAEYEVQNLQKCLRSGFAHIWSIAPTDKRKRAVRAAAQNRLATEDLARVEFLTTEEMVFALSMLAEDEPQESVVRGYKVSVSRKVVSPEDAKERQASIARIVAQSLRD
jgi:hypothetical protein